MAINKHITIDLAELGVLRITCSACQTSVPVPVAPNYLPPARCPNSSCLATWFLPNTPAALAIQGYMTVSAALRETMTEVPARIQFVIPAPD